MKAGTETAKAAAGSGPRYAQIYATLREWIFQGSCGPGSRLPTEQEICRMFGVSRITTRRALAMLAAEGLIHAHPGRGTFVVEDVADAPVIGDMERLLRKVDRLARTSQVGDATLDEIEPDADTLRDLHLEPGARVQRATHLRLVNGTPIGYVTTDIPSHLQIRLDLEELKTCPMLKLLERRGVDIASADETISATLADARLSQLLNVPVGAALVRIRLVVFDGRQRPVERMLAWYRADNYHHRVRLTRQIHARRNSPG